MTPKQKDSHRDGISIEDRWKARGSRQGKRWLAKVRDTRMQRYKRKAFVDLEVAKVWAKTMRARFELAEANAGTWPLEDVLTDLLALMKREGRSQTYINTMARHGKMLQSVGVRDLSEDGLHAKVRLYLELPTDEKHRRQEGSQPSASTIRYRFGHVRIIASHAMRFQGMSQDPLARFVMPASGRASARTSDQETYNLEEVRAVLALDRRDDPIWLAFLISIYSGLRAFELRALRWEAIDWDTHTIRIARGKGGKARIVSMQPDLYEFLRNLGGPSAERPRLGSMCPLNEARLQVRHLQPLLDLAKVTWDRGASETTGLPRRLGWHACRRTCAAASLACGVDSLDIQRSLGHEEISLTGEYAGAFTRWKAQVSAEGWPRGRLCFLAAPAASSNAQAVQ